MSVKRLALGELKLPGTTTVERIKAVDTNTGKLLDLAFDESGKRADVEQLFEGITRRRFEKFGRIHEALWQHIQSRPTNQRIDVIVWPRITKGTPTYGRTTLQQGVPEEEKQFLDEVHSMRETILEKLQVLNAQVPQEYQQVPPRLRQTLVYVPASIAAGQIEALARDDSVGVILLDDRSAINDLRDSINIARSNTVHQLGATGKGVKVAVFESGPKDTINLSFAARYSQNPPESQHAKLTSAIIKNTEPNAPHGHAPGCDLYSANSGDNSALLRALTQGCTVISQSFHRSTEPHSGDLLPDDILHDWLALRTPFPTIVHAAGNY